jgi:arginase
MSQFPLVWGGDCSILLGSALALKRRGRFGLLFIDGHTDLLTPTTSPTGGVAGMNLAIVTGSGPIDLISIEGLIPHFQPEDVVLLGFRWPKPGKGSTAQPLPPMSSFSFSMIEREGAAVIAEQAVARFAGREFWVHLDADVLDPRWMAASTVPTPAV